MRLFCLPYAGGAASIYYRWQSAFPDDFDVCPIELPGRLTRLNETPFREVGPLVKSLCGALDHYFDVPFAFFGYSMGALIAFEWARELASSRGLEPEHLVVAARVAPHIRPKFLHETVSMPDREFVAQISSLYGPRIQRILTDPELRTIVLRMMRADLELLDRYNYQESAKLRSPITVLGGERDTVAAHESLGAWSRHTTGEFAVRLFPGDHFFIHAHEHAVIQAVRAAIDSRAIAPMHPTPVQAW